MPATLKVTDMKPSITKDAGGDRRRPLDERRRYTMRRASARRFLIPFSSTGEREEVLDSVQLAECTGHDELQVVEVLAGSRLRQRDHVEREEPTPRGKRDRRNVAHEEEDGIEIDLPADRFVLKPVGCSQAVPSAFALLLGSAFAFVLGLGDVLHLGDDHPLHLLWRGEALVWVPVLVHVFFLSVAFATAHMMP